MVKDHDEIHIMDIRVFIHTEKIWSIIVYVFLYQYIYILLEYMILLGM